MFHLLQGVCLQFLDNQEKKNILGLFAAHCAYGEGVCGIDTKFRSTPRSTTSGQHLLMIASLSMAAKFNHI